METTTQYNNKPISSNILSYLDVTKDGKVVTAEAWCALWNAVINYTNTIGVALSGIADDVSVINTDVESIKTDLQTVFNNEATLLENMNNLSEEFTAHEDAYNAAVEASIKTQQIYDSLSDGLVWVGATPPPNEHYKIWLCPKEDIPTVPTATSELTDDAKLGKTVKQSVIDIASSETAQYGIALVDFGGDATKISPGYVNISDLKFIIPNHIGITDDGHLYTRAVELLDSPDDWDPVYSSMYAVPKKYVDDLVSNIGQLLDAKQDALTAGDNIEIIGNVIKATVEKGAKGDKGDKGDPGADGYTPVKGTDYWTDADKTEIINAVLAALPDGSEVSY